MKYTFEMGPIRPPSEAESILLRITRNCPWNKCEFCSIYKEHKFALRTPEEIKEDIDAIYFISEKLKEISRDHGFPDRINYSAFKDVINELNIPSYYVKYVTYWLRKGFKSVFLQDADSLVMKTDKLVEILNYLKEKFPAIERITSYTRSKTLALKSIQELESIRKAGINRLHTGLESGSRKILKLMRKGVTPEEQISGGRKAIEAGFELSEYYMPGLGGKELLEENAMESARVLNEINPTFIRLRSVVPHPASGIYKYMIENKWLLPSEEDRVREIKIFIENLGGISSTLVSDHNINLLEDLSGKMPEDKAKMLEILKRYFSMSSEDRESFLVGKRLGRYRYLSDYEYSDEIELLKKRFKDTYCSLDEALLYEVLQYSL